MSVNPQPLIATIYNPHNQSKDALIAGFIARKQKFERLFRDIREAPMTTPEQHILVQGIRGMGKTTLLLRIAYEVDNTPELRQRLIPVVFNEEEYGIGSLADVWERTAQYLGETDASFVDLYDTMTQQYGEADYERQAFQTLIGALQKQHKKLLLLIDNVGDVLKKLDTQEEQRLREVLLTTPELRLIGATSVIIEQVHDYTRPFYEFFKIIHLDGLTQQEAIELFLKLGETYHAAAVEQLTQRQPGRIEAIRRLTGGVIRTMVLLFEIMVENDSGSVFRDLEVLLDRVTPLYKHRMDDLPAQQQKVVAALAQAWDAANTKELAQVVRLESKVVSAQLKQLINSGLVEKVETHTKNHLYRLEERFFNIWYLMRFGRKTDQRVLWLVRFFETMFAGNAEWMQERIDGHLQAMEAGTLDAEAALFLTTAFSGILKDEELEDLLNKTTKLYLVSKGRQELANEVGYSRYEKVTKMLQEQQYESAISLLSRFKNKTLSVYVDLIGCHLLINKQETAMMLFIDFMKNKNNLIRQFILFFHLRSITKGRSRLPLGPYAIYEEFVSLLLNPRKPRDIKITSSIHTVIAELVAIYFNKNITDRKEFALSLANKLIEMYSLEPALEIVPNIRVAIAIINLWNNSYDIPNNNLLHPFHHLKHKGIVSAVSNRLWLYNSYLKLLLAKKQYHTAYNYFTHEEWQLKDQFKPLYYATLFFLKDEYPTEYLRMGPELKETVDEILTEVTQMAIDYA